MSISLSREVDSLTSHRASLELARRQEARSVAGTLTIDMPATFQAVILMASGPKLKFGSTEQGHQRSRGAQVGRPGCRHLPRRAGA
jgi:hypothetical protein